MPRSTRSILTAALLALQAVLTVGGSGLHAMPGMGHGSELNRPSRDDHSHGPGKTSHDLTEDCPVCHFLTGEQARPDGSVRVAGWLVTAADPVSPVADPPSPSRRPTAARAPPALS